jgi:hypothetical protein
MAFEPGNNLNPSGRPVSQKSFAAMLKLAINEAGQQPGTTRLRDVADALVNHAIYGNINAIKEIADRLDGKVPQGIAGDPENPFTVALTGQIELVAVSAQPKD